MALGSSLYDSESYSDMRSLGRVRDRLPHDLAKAVRLAPAMLRVYIEYALVSAQDPHSDYAVQMEVVCRVQHHEFVKALDELPLGKRDWFVSHILNPEGCRALALPEAR